MRMIKSISDECQIKKINFFSIPLFGHVNYGLKIAQRLKQCGYEVVYYSGIAYKQFIEDTGVTFHPYSEKIEKLFSFKESTYNNEYMQYVRAEKLNHITEWYKFCHHLYTITEIFMRVDIKEMQPPDLIVYDSAALWGRYISKHFGIKSIASCTPYTYPEKFAETDLNRFSRLIFHRNLSSIKTKRLVHLLNHRLDLSCSSVSPCSIFEPIDPKSDYKFIYTVKDFQAGCEYLDLDTTFFCGVMQENDVETAEYLDLIDHDTYNIYIAFGSIYNNAEIFKQIYENCKNLEYNFILNIGKTINPDVFSGLPNNWKVVRGINQFELLEHVDLFVSHGGVNSVREAVHHGVPIIVFPTEGDTLCTAEDIKNNQLGIVLDIGCIDLIKFAIEEIIRNDIIKENCRKISTIMQNSIGLCGVVDIIENILRSQ